MSCWLAVCYPEERTRAVRRRYGVRIGAAAVLLLNFNEQHELKQPTRLRKGSFNACEMH